MLALVEGGKKAGMGDNSNSGEEYLYPSAHLWSLSGSAGFTQADLKLNCDRRSAMELNHEI